MSQINRAYLCHALGHVVVGLAVINYRIVYPYRHLVYQLWEETLKWFAR